MTRERVRFPFLNAEHFRGHLFMLPFATAAALALIRGRGMTHARLIPRATPGFIAFGVFGQVPVNDVLLGGIANSEWRARIFGARFIVGFAVMAPAVPILAWLHADWGFLTYCSERRPRAHAWSWSRSSCSPGYARLPVAARLSGGPPNNGVTPRSAAVWMASARHSFNPGRQSARERYRGSCDGRAAIERHATNNE